VLEHRKFNDSKPERIRAVADAIRAHDPNVIGILEFLAKDAARRLVRDFFSDYDFAFTDSKMAIEILVGWRRGKFAQVLYTQRRELQAGSENLRPGGLLCVRQKNSQQFNNMLFLHTDSGVTAKEYKTRRTMFGKIFSLNKVLQTLHEQEGKSRFIALGDLNTMGRVKALRVTPVTETEEIAQLVVAAGEANMQLLEKSAPKTWSSPTDRKKAISIMSSRARIWHSKLKKPSMDSRSKSWSTAGSTRRATPGVRSSRIFRTTRCCL
jgi:hypothetical protein